jgi:hypothetical protein
MIVSKKVLSYDNNYVDVVIFVSNGEKIRTALLTR